MNLKYLESLRKYAHFIKPGSENDEQIQVITYLENNNYIFTSIPNSTYTKSFKQKIMNFLLGLRPGLPDLLIKLKSNKLLFIEMKKKRGKKGGLNGSKISEAQQNWVNEINTVDGVQAMICHGGLEAIDQIKRLELI